MKTGHTQKLPEEVRIVLMEDGKEVCVTYAASEAAAGDILERWKAGTYQLLSE